MRDSFIFYKSFYDSIKNLEDKYQLELYVAICEYSLYGEEPLELSPIATALFTLMKPNIDNSTRRYDANVNNGKKGGRPKKNNDEEKPNENPKETQTKPNENLNVNKDKDKDVNKNIDLEKENIKEKKRFCKPTIEQIEDYCRERNNGISGTTFYDFYESKGWKVGTTPMKDWKACVRTWEQKNGRTNNAKVVEEKPREKKWYDI